MANKGACVQLLVSVRSAGEARAALDAGARILDAKEPALGALGPVAAGGLAGIAALVPAGVMLSVALGEPSGRAELAALLAARACLHARPAFLKFVPPAMDIETMASLVTCARSICPRAHVIIAAYADRVPVHALQAVARTAAAAGADGVLLDTAAKESSLFARMSDEGLRDFVVTAQVDGLLVGLAGSISLADFPRVAGIGADVIGVRGAACDGGRDGAISAARVRALVAAARSTRPARAVPAS